MSFWSGVGDFFRGSLKRQEPRYVPYLGTVVWGVILGGLGIALFSSLINLWPVVDAPSTAEITAERRVNFLWGLFTLELTKSTGLLVLVIIAGALGSYIHASTRFVKIVAARNLKSSWMWWYGLRLFSGASLALLVYLGVRGGLFGGQASAPQVDPYGTAAFAGLVGLFSRQATEKLEEVFDTVFSGGGKPPAGDPGEGGDSPD